MFNFSILLFLLLSITSANAGNLAEDLLNSFSDQNPYSMDYNGAKDICIINGKSCMKKEMAHINWLHKQCNRGSSAACKRLGSGAYTPAPTDRYPGGGRMNVPYSPGTEPVPSVDPYANIRSAP